MTTRLSSVRDGNWKGFRRVARYYERELRRIRNATLCDASTLRDFAAKAILPKRRKPHS